MATRALRCTGLAFAGAAAFLALLPHVRDHETTDVSSLEREGRSRFLKTANGVIHYEAAGPATGPAVVLVHGVSGPMSVWDLLVPRLAAAGLRVVRYDLFGRGLSDRPDVTCDEALFDRQLADVLDGTGLRGPVTLVGSSMGAIVAAGFRERHPDRVSRLVLIGPAGFPIEASPAARLLHVRGVGEYLMSVAGDAMLQAHHRRYFVRPDEHPDAHAAFAAQLRIHGTKRAILSTMRAMPVQDYRDGYGRLGGSGVPVTVVWGRQDATFPFDNAPTMQALVPQARLIALDGAAHLPQLERPDEVAAEVVGLAAVHPAPNAVTEGRPK